jgi:hypothetical protein
MWTWITRTPAWIVFLLMISSVPVARQAEFGSIEGQISDDLGPVPDASVEGRNIMTSVFTTARSDASGRYRLLNLRAGRYSLWIQAAGHNSVSIPRVIVERGQVSVRDLQLVRTHATTTGSNRAVEDRVSHLQVPAFSK